MMPSPITGTPAKTTQKRAFKPLGTPAQRRRDRKKVVITENNREVRSAALLHDQTRLIQLHRQGTRQIRTASPVR
jgi:hypothetical protein